MTQELKLSLEFIRYSLNPKDELPKDVAKMDWEGFFQFAGEQGILGVVFAGIQQLGEQGVKPPFEERSGDGSLITSQ